MSKKELYALILCIGLTVAMGACGLLSGSEADPLEGTSWVLNAYDKSKPIPGTRITANFKGGRVHGSAGCNTYQGTYEVDGERLAFSELAWTLMACMEPEGVMEQEQRVMRIMGGVERFEMLDGELVLKRADQETLVFQSRSKP